METKAINKVYEALRSIFSETEANVDVEVPIKTKEGLGRVADIVMVHSIWGFYLFEVKGSTVNNLRIDQTLLQQIKLLLLDFGSDENFRNLKLHAVIALPNVTQREFASIIEEQQENYFPVTFLFKEDLEWALNQPRLHFDQKYGRELSELSWKLSNAVEIDGFQSLTPPPKNYRKRVPSKHHIFISYRRQDSAWAAGRLSDHLKAEYGDNYVFLDIANISSGRRFKKVIEERIQNSSILLVVIGDTWLTLSHPDSGKRRIDEDGDYVRWEIKLALDQKLIVIPVLLDNSKVPNREHLPEEIQELTEINVHRLRAMDFESDIARLIKVIDVWFDELGILSKSKVSGSASPLPVRLRSVKS